jgi:hypothetical protein
MSEHTCIECQELNLFYIWITAFKTGERLMADKIQLNNGPDSASQRQSAPAPKAEDFAGSAVTKAVLKESLQHPATIFPLAASALALSWTVIVAPSPASLALMLGLAFTSASSFVYNYVIKGPEKAQNYISRLRELRRKSEVQSLDQLAVTFRRSGFVEAAKEAQELKAAYQQLANFLTQNSQLSSVDRFNVLAEETLRQGVSVLQQALMIFTAMESVDVDHLEADLSRWQMRLSHLDENSTEYRALKQQIDSHTKRIDLYKQSYDKLTQLVAESNEIETALQTTYLELVDSGNQNLDDFLREDGSAVNRLNQAVAAAKRVEQKLRGDDEEEQARQKKYLDLEAQQHQQQN